MAKGDAAWARQRRLDAIDAAEKSGLVADSRAVRAALIARMDAGELTLEQVQTELARIKRGASRRGLMTRYQVLRRA